jgi:alpha-galactosidase
MSRIVNIVADDTSLLLLLPERGMPQIHAWGQIDPITGPARSAQPDALVQRAGRANGMDASVPMAVLLPTGGMGNFGWPAIAGHRDGQDFTLEFSGWRAEEQESFCRLHAFDPIARIGLEIEITGSSSGVFSMRCRVSNEGSSHYTLDRCMAGTMIIDGNDPRLTAFDGMWGREFQIRNESLGKGLWLQENRRGRTSHDRFPGVIIEAEGLPSRFQGPMFSAMHLGWSGNHVIAIDRLDDGRRLVHAGELFESGEMRVAPGETYESPKAYFAKDDWNGECLANRFRNFACFDLVKWPGGEMRDRPVTLNTWEGVYFNHKLDQLKAQATAAADIGVERFVLDDGWFGRRDDDTSSLGDWFIDERKYPQGLKPLVDHVSELGMEFGLWIEPEMVNPDSDLYRAHPEWALHVQGRPLLLSRNQLVLDLTRQDTATFLFDCIHKVLAEHQIVYLKWDMNRDLTHAGGSDRRAKTSAQTRAVYALMERVREAHPDVEIESCASGGGRADYGALARTHRIWTSDCTDALERLEIQLGASKFFPRAVLGAHISASPNHQTGRQHSLAFRAIVALPYHFGIELNLLELAEEERNELKSWIALHKRLRPALHGSNGFSLPPQDGRYIQGAIDNFSGDGVKRIFVFVAQARQMLAEQPPPLRLPIDQPVSKWRVVNCHPQQPAFVRMSESQKRLFAGDVKFSSTDLFDTGLPLPMLRPESGVILEIEQC